MTANTLLKEKFLLKRKCFFLKATEILFVFRMLVEDSIAVNCLKIRTMIKKRDPFRHLKVSGI